MSYRVYFGRLPESLSQDDFEKMLSEHGKARNIEWKSGYAYVDYKHGSDASKTVQNLNGKEIGGNNILVELARNGGAGGYAVAGAFATRSFAKPPQPRPIRTPHRVRIENLSSRTRWMELKELLSLAGEVTFADTHKRKTGEGIVEFATRSDMEEAIKTFHNTSFYGKSIKLYDESPRGRSRSPRGRSRSPSGHKSRSPSRHRSSERRRRSPSRSKSPRRKSSSSRHRSRSPRRRSQSLRRRSQSLRRRSKDHSKDRSRPSRKKESRSRTPRRNSHRKSKKSKRDSSHSRSKSPRHKKHKHSRSHSSPGNNNDSKRKSRVNKKHLSNSSASDSSDSDKSK